MKTGLLIKELRIKKGLTQEELAEMTELSARTIQRIEKGEVDPRSYTLQMIAKALDVDYNIFVKNQTSEDRAENDQFILGLIHLSGVLLLFFPTILIWNSKKQKVKAITEHFNYVISFQLSIWLISILPGFAIHYFMGINHLPNRAIYMVFVGIAFAVFFSVVNTISVMNNKPYKHFYFVKWGKNDKKET